MFSNNNVYIIPLLFDAIDSLAFYLGYLMSSGTSPCLNAIDAVRSSSPVVLLSQHCSTHSTPITIEKPEDANASLTGTC